MKAKLTFSLTSLMAIGLLGFCVPLFAHHGAAVFDTAKKVTMKATVTQWIWSNPHSILLFDVKDASGQVVHWVGESDNPPNLVNRGWSVNSFKPGDQVTVTLQPVKNGRPIGRVVEAILPDGKVLGQQNVERSGEAPGGSQEYPK